MDRSRYGKDVRKGLANKNDAPAPGMYEPKYRSVEPNSRSNAFGRDQRKDLQGRIDSNVGPGQYNWDKNVKRGGFNKFGKDERKTISVNNNQGPGAYEVQQNDLGKNYGQGYSMRKKTKLIEGSTGYVPGPGNYGIKGTLSDKGFKMGKDLRKPIGDDNKVPGPGKYSNPNMKNLLGTKFGKEARNTVGNDWNQCGPGQYNVHKDDRYKVGSYSFGRDKRKGITDENRNPGPGNYSMKNMKDDGNGWSIGRAKRPEINGGVGRFDVGPGQYNVGKAITGGFSFGKKDRTTVETHYTPGFYKIPASVPDVPKYLLKNK